MDETTTQSQTQEQEIERRKSLLDRGNDLYRRYQNARTVVFLAQRAAPLLANPWVWIVVGVLILLILIVFFFFLPNKEQLKPIPEEELKIDKLVDKTQAKIGEEIRYTIGITYNKPGEIEVTDVIADGAKFKRAIPLPSSNDGKTIKWKLQPVSEGTGGNEARIYPTIQLIIEATEDNIKIENKAIASISGGGVPPIGSPPGTGVIIARSPIIHQYFIDAANLARIPPAMPYAIAGKESAVLSWEETDEQVRIMLSAPKWWEGRRNNQPKREQNDPLILKGYGYNTCQYNFSCSSSDVRGVMQIEVDTWPYAQEAADAAGIRNASRIDARSAIYASAQIIVNKIKAAKLNIPTGLNSWTEEQVKQVARAYCGKNPTRRYYDDNCDPSPSDFYEDIVWALYQKYSQILVTSSN